MDGVFRPNLELALSYIQFFVPRLDFYRAYASRLCVEVDWKYE